MNFVGILKKGQMACLITCLALVACGIGPSTLIPSPDTATPGPTATEIAPTQTPTATPNPTITATETETPTLAPTEVYSEVYTFDPAEHENITFDELPFIDYEVLRADDLSTSIQVGDKVMEKALPVQETGITSGPNFITFTLETRLDPNHSSYISHPETRPLKIVRAFRTEVNGKNLPGAIILAKNLDGSTTK